jgi:hypothetical protein
MVKDGLGCGINGKNLSLAAVIVGLWYYRIVIARLSIFFDAKNERTKVLFAVL